MFLFIYLFICLAEPSHSCGIQGLLVVACGIPWPGIEPGCPHIASEESWLLDHQEVPTIFYVWPTYIGFVQGVGNIAGDKVFAPMELKGALMIKDQQPTNEQLFIKYSM